MWPALHASFVLEGPVRSRLLTVYSKEGWAKRSRLRGRLLESSVPLFALCRPHQRTTFLKVFVGVTVQLHRISSYDRLDP